MRLQKVLYPARSRRRAFAFTAALAVGLVLSGCAVFKPPSPEEQVARRAEQRWRALIAGDLPRAYGYLTPASRAVVPFERWRATLGGGATAWKAVKVSSVACDSSEKCVAIVTITHEPVMFRTSLGSIDSSLAETWLSDDGQWWLLTEP